MNRHVTHQDRKHGEAHAGKQGAPRQRRTGKAPAPDHSDTQLAQELRRAMIAEAAYYRAEKRGFAPGDELGDWLQAEAEIESLLQQTMRVQ